MRKSDKIGFGLSTISVFFGRLVFMGAERNRYKPLVWLVVGVVCAVIINAGGDFTSTKAGIDQKAPTINGYQLVSENEGWLWLDNNLYWTRDGGRVWMNINPSQPVKGSLRSVFFLDSQTGWALLSGAENPERENNSIALTIDGGVSWQLTSLNLPSATEIDFPIDRYQLFFVDQRHGYLALRHATGSNFSLGSLFSTADGGNTWQRREIPLGESVYFLSPEVGWTAGGARGDALYRTTDGGISWINQSVRLQRQTDQPKIIPALPVFSDELQGSLPVFYPQSNGGEIIIWQTQDGGDTWQIASQLKTDREIDSFADAPVASTRNGDWLILGMQPGKVTTITNMSELSSLISSDKLVSDIIALDMVSRYTGWARYAAGNCVSANDIHKGQPTPDNLASLCITQNGLLRTEDGGRTWTILPLPDVAAYQQANLLMTEEHIIEVGFPERETTDRDEEVNWTISIVGQGFDKCEIASYNQLQTWKANSPYQAVNLYIGGSMRACKNTGLTATLITQLDQLGWTFIPTWVGPQASCTKFEFRMSSNPTTAYAQGVAEANLAVNTATSLGLTAPESRGTVLYYDLEYYDTGNPTCNEAAKAFISGWTAQVRARGSLAGVYSNGPPLSGFASIPNVPDAIWPAHWISSGYNPNATVWNVYLLSNSLWSNHQRIRQYAGGHAEVWGGVSMNIDSNVIDGIVSVVGDGIPGWEFPWQHYFPIIRK